MAWYSTGTVSVTNGSKNVSGVGTAWFGALQAGWGFVGPDGRTYEVLAVNGATSLTLKTNYQGATAGGQIYAAFPTVSLAGDLVERLNALIGGFQTVKDEAGAGKFGGGSASAPGVRGLTDQDTGLVWPASNQLGQSVGGVIKALLSNTAYKIDVPITGAAVQSSPTDTTPNRLLKMDAFGLGADAGPNVTNVDTHYTSGFYYCNGGAHNTPASGDNPFPTMNGAFGLLVGNSSVGDADDYVWQIAIDVSGGNGTKYRTRGNVGWTSWGRFLTDDDVQSSDGDATAGSLMRVNAFGLGSSTGLPPDGNNANNAVRPGFYCLTNTSANNPAGNTSVLRVERSYNVIVQEVVNVGGAPRKWSRRSTDHGATWGAWDVQTATLVGTVSQSGGVPTGAVIQRGSNGNGEFVRFADGTQICWVTAAPSGADAVWTFPAAFITTSNLCFIGAGRTGTDASFVSFRNAASTASVEYNHWSHAGVRLDNLGVSLVAYGQWY
ncbi:pyocin knob domain-containing protein [Sulfitobacter sp. M21595]|uniref:pyocin knob domain-containing protein n=1 Tax=Sulfitobacter sp. M21595 TaxID=3368574 RepID=UPI0037477CC9